GKRSVQLYIRQIKKRWADEASREDYLAALWKSHKQHEAVLFKAFQLIDKVDDQRLLVHLLRTVERLLKARDENLATIAEHRRATHRDKSLDGIEAACLRGKRITMPVEELIQRLNYLLKDRQQAERPEADEERQDEPDSERSAEPSDPVEANWHAEMASAEEFYGNTVKAGEGFPLSAFDLFRPFEGKET
ncbi:MAG: hypothetical protein NZM31_14175, partial [Gemmatales bacterium]|nr:hypothetical protein [Gemmatales bacterium]MDW8388143.1 hypothetical protein [Gemmatales bacterium]